MFPLSHKEIIDTLFAEYPGVATTSKYNAFYFEIQNNDIPKEIIEEKLIDLLSNECRLAFEAGFKAALVTMI
jgi:hypothetical protein